MQMLVEGEITSPSGGRLCRQDLSPKCLYLGWSLALNLSLPGCRGPVIPRCQLVRILRQYGLEGFGRRSGADWVCLARHKSCYNTKAINCSKNGSSDYGIFQINSKYCGYDGRTLGASNGGCHMPCSKLLDNNIADDIRCAKLNARKARGLMPWVAWKKCCRGKDLKPYVRGC
nr:LOW QUALITY PROTEIN: lysozyme C-like [Caretta caretta]